MKINQLISLIIILAVSAHALVDESKGKPERYSPEKSFHASKMDTAFQFDILKYSLSVRLPMVNDSLYGQQLIDCVKNTAKDSLYINCVRLSVDSVKINDINSSYTITDDTLGLWVNIAAINYGQRCTIAVFYRGGNFIKNGTYSRGYYWYPKDYDVNTLHAVGYTMSEPQDARMWMPCIDDPWEKADSGCNIQVTVPDSFTVASNGLFVDTLRSGDNLVWIWSESRPIATYLMSFTVSKYASWTDTATTSKGDTVFLHYCVWPEDSATASVVFDSVSQMMDCFTSRFGPYPFAKYGMAAVYPFAFGGMEHQGMTTIHRNWILGNAQRGIAHELAHMWWGDEVTCGYWADIWLNEGFASYSEAIYDEYKTGRLPGAYLSQYFWRALRATGYSIYNPPPESLFATSMVYQKGAWVLQGLRWVMGDSTFFAALNAYGDSFSYGNAVTSEFQRIAEHHYGSSLQWYFDQWVYRAGHPIYSTVTYYKTHGDSNSAWVRLSHTSNTGELYKMPLALACSTASGIDSTVVVWDSLALQDFMVHDDQPIFKVKLDPDNWVLKEWNDYSPVLARLDTNISKYGDSFINVYWNAFWPDPACAGFNVYRADNAGGPFIRINADAIADTVYKDSTTSSGTEYYYCVTAVSSLDTCYETHQSNVLSITAGGTGVDGGFNDKERLTDDVLWQNKPNPFSRATTISYQLVKSGWVSLKVYNLNGQLVKTMVNFQQPAGKYQVNWDGRNQLGQKVSSGIYVYCLRAGERELVKQMQFIR